MNNIELEIKNYRCFSDEKPLRINIGCDFIGFIGANNSGKSCILKFFYEFRYVWNIVKNPESLVSCLNGTAQNVDILGVMDSKEIFHKFNERDIAISIKVGVIKICFKVLRNVNQKCTIGHFELHHNNIQNKLGQYALRRDGIIYIPNLQNRNLFEYPDLSEFFIVLDIIIDSIYIPSFRNAINSGVDGSYFDILLGGSFIDGISSWMTGGNVEHNELMLSVQNNIKELFDFKDFHINVSSNPKTLQFTIDGKSYKLKDIGSGVSQFVLVYSSVAIKKPSIIFIDEPELNLHPALQQKFIMSLREYASKGVVFATHSLGLARSVADKIYSVRRKENNSEVFLLEKTPGYAELLGELSFSSYQELGVEKILLVEGPTDIKTFIQFLRLVKKEKEFVILSMGGRDYINANREQELSEIMRISNKVFCWIDSERKTEKDDLDQGRKEFLKICSKIGIKAQASLRRSTENYLGERAIKKVKGDKVVGLGYYDELISWGKNENWLIANEMRKDELGDDLIKFLEGI